jgi:(1->4)-alpha-D-glucan 1-alpha-D-glucosylmutase
MTPPSPKNYPRSTYRIQFREGMTFDRAAALVPYLKRLGISHLYASPIFTAASGSTHGYDVSNANEIDPSIGGRAGFERMARALHDAGLGLLLDIVPNHMAASLENAWWRSAVEWGRESPFSHYFDIDWNRKLTLPILGKPIEDVIKDGELSFALDPDAGVLAVAYFDNLIPLHPATYASVLSHLDLPVAGEIGAIAAGAVAEDEREFHDRIKAAVSNSGARQQLTDALWNLSRDDGVLRSVLEDQAWQLIYWKRAASELSYRRFFEVTGLAGLRVEDEDVFEASHRLTLELVRSGLVDSLRLDHIDGLVNPKQYLDRLRAAVGPDTYIIVEKILGEEERLPQGWPIAGTSGYEFITAMTNLFIDAGKANELDRAYDEVDADGIDYQTVVRHAKSLLVDRNFAVEAGNLLKLLAKISGAGRDGMKEQALKSALREILVAFPVYRTYGTVGPLDETDIVLWDGVLNSVAARSDAPDAAALQFIDKAFKGDVVGEATSTATEFRLRFQQLTGPLTAKAIEDTTFYRFNRLIALNEVGGDPVGHELGIERFHRAMQERAATQPYGLSTTSTHDTKRGEDTRTRLYSISEAPDQWRDAVARWRRMNASHVSRLDDGPAPEPEVEWLLYQALAGVWPADLGERSPPANLETRFLAYLEKGLREAKMRTNWGEENAAYEEAVAAYASALLHADNDLFLADFGKTLKPFIRAGLFNGLTQTVVKLTAPGIPDIYQGAECLDLSLVDPDNRRAPDFDGLQRSLEAGRLVRYEHMLQSGVFKQNVIAKGLALRNAEPHLFGEGVYLPLDVVGDRRDQVVAFLRGSEEALSITVAPRFLLGLDETAWPCGDYWGDTAVVLPDDRRARRLTNVLDDAPLEAGGRLPLASVLGTLPVALLFGKR